jgi:hypothetical protein
MKFVLPVLTLLFLTSCWKPYRGHTELPPQQKVWGNKPVYEAITTAKKIVFVAGKQPLSEAGNIYAYHQFIFQVDVGRGIHVIDNAVPADAERIGFISVNGCSQISIKGSFLYINSYADLVTINISDPVNLKEVSRVQNAFPDFNNNYPLVMPAESGYYECPRMDSMVVGWVKDSVFAGCYKN